jgi:hypothetical protein
MATYAPKSVSLQAHPPMLPTECPTKIVTVGQRIVCVPSKMNYVSANTEEVHLRRNMAGDDDGTEFNEGANWIPEEVNVQNARGQGKTLETNGFELVAEPIMSSTPVDFLNTEDVIDIYYPTCENLLKTHFGKGVIVKAFDHNIRINSSKDQLKGSGGAKTQAPVALVHGDYTMESGPKRLSDLGNPPKANDVLKQRLGETPLLDPDTVGAALAGKRRFALINVWRNIDTNHPVEERPLACVDSLTVVQEDLRKLYIHYADRVGENYVAAFRPQHNWCYFPRMTHDEAMLIKQWDSKGSFALGEMGRANDRATFAIHSAFLDPTSPETAPPRKSIEVRCALIWEDEAGDQSN